MHCPYLVYKKYYIVIVIAPAPSTLHLHRCTCTSTSTPARQQRDDQRPEKLPATASLIQQLQLPATSYALPATTTSQQPEARGQRPGGRYKDQNKKQNKSAAERGTRAACGVGAGAARCSVLERGKGCLFLDGQPIDVATVISVVPIET
jgi:hypothetical protein